MSAKGKRRSRLRLLTLLFAAGAGGALFVALADLGERSRSWRRGAQGEGLDDLTALPESVGVDREVLDENDEAHRRLSSGAGSEIPDRPAAEFRMRIELIPTQDPDASTHLLATSAPPHLKVICAAPHPVPAVRVLEGSQGDLPLHAFIGATLLGAPVTAESESTFSYALTFLDRVADGPNRREQIRIEATCGGETAHLDVHIASQLYGPQVQFSDPPREDGLVPAQAFVEISDLPGIAAISFSLYAGNRDLHVSPFNTFVGVSTLREVVDKELPIRDQDISVEFWARPEWRRLDNLWARFRVVSVDGKVFESTWRHVGESEE